MTYSYFVSAQTDEFRDDDGDYQVSLMTQKIESETRLSDEDAHFKACDEGDWKIYFGEGETNDVDDYWVEETTISDDGTKTVTRQNF